MKIINLISGPRNLSTALMYSFGSKINPSIKSKDAIVIDNTSLNFAQQNELIFNYIQNVTT